MFSGFSMVLGAERMGEIEDVCLAALNDDLAMAADIGVVRPCAGYVEDRRRLLSPAREIIRAKNGHPFPAVDEHPVGALPPEDGGPFLGCARDDGTGDPPPGKVLAVRSVDVRAMGLVLEPHPPAPVPLSHDERIDHPVGAQRDNGFEFPVDEVPALVVDDVPFAAPVRRDAPDIGKEHMEGPAVLDETGGPESVPPRFELESLGRPPVSPSQAAVGRGGDADVRAVAPAHAVLGVGRVGPAVGIKDPPGPFLVVPDQGRIGRPVENGIAIERRRRLARFPLPIPAA